MKVLLAGADGYIGTVLASVLTARGHDVTGLDTGFYRSGWLYHSLSPYTPPSRTRDIRSVGGIDLSGFEAVVHLAELSNDPLGQLNPAVTFAINHQGSVRLAGMAKEANVTRFVYTSSCSVYGIGANGLRDETSEVCPQSTYAQCKVLVERDVASLADDDFTPTFLRNATAYGPSPRMRFDIVVNNLAGYAWTEREIRMKSDGSPWRPLVHVLDICEAVAATLEAPREVVHNQVFNVGANEGNYRVREVAEIVADTFPGCALSVGTSDGDNRSYRVSFDKIHEKLPGFRARRSVAQGAEELRSVFERIGLTAELFNARPYTRLKELQHLIETGQVDQDLFWRPF